MMIPEKTKFRLAVWLLLWALALPMLPADAVELGKADTLELEFRVGGSGKVGTSFKFADGKSQTLNGVVKADAMRRTVTKDGKKVPEMVPMPDGLIDFGGSGLKLQYHTRPRLSRYTEAQQAELAARWESLAGAAQSWVPLEVRVDAGGAELWLSGRYGGRLLSESRLVEVSFKFGEGGEVRGERAFTRADTGRYLALDVRRIAQPGAMKDGTVSLKPGPQVIEKIPMLVADGAGNADVGVVKEMQGSRFLETDENTSRTSLDGMQESLHFSVPQAFYHRAWVLCAVEPDAKKDPVLTTRLTRFGVSGRGGAMADTTLTLPRGEEKPGDGIRQIGSVEFPAAGGQTVSVPLYLVRVDLRTGSILDLFSDSQDPIAPMKIGPYLDFEFLGKCDGLSFADDRRRKPLASSTSGVHVFGVTLEKAPVELRIKQAQAGNIFHNDETPETTFAVRASAAGRYLLRWEISDAAGVSLGRHEKAFELTTVGSETDLTIPLAMPEVGWYGLRVTLSDAAGVELFEHDAAFALLGKDTRTAGYESPFGTWWFTGQQTVQSAGPMLFKAGMRRGTVNSLKENEEDLAPWKITLNQIHWSFRRADLKDWPAAEARAEKAIGDTLKRFPHCEYIDLFHESYGPATYPPELYGEKYEVDPVVTQQEDELYELGVKAARFMRAKFPQLKIIAGNSNGSAGIAAMMLRRGFSRDLIDYLGSEAGGQTISPEKLTPHGPGGIWLMNETARIFGYDIPPTGCFEFTYRCESKLGARRLAEWYAQDMLLGLTYRFPTVSPAALEDVGNAYFDTLWGASGLCQRQPLHYPKPAYVALATMTRVLDRVKLVQQMPTGSSSAHALEFDRGGLRVYALWTPRGQCEMEFEFPNETELTGIGIYGRPEGLRTEGKRLTVTAGAGVRYLISPVAVTRVTAGRRTFPDDQPPAGARVIQAMDDVAAWQLTADELKPALPQRRPGKFELRRVVDDEKGPCLELQLQAEGEVPAVVGEYTTLRLPQPIPIAGEPHTMGVWVKGDSSGGRIFWQLEDAKGEQWVSSNGFEGGDWGNHAAIDFDGWCFVTFALTESSPAFHVEPQPGLGQWRHSAEGKLDYPLKLTGLSVETHRQSLDLTRMQPVKGTIRLKDVSAIGAEK